MPFNNDANKSNTWSGFGSVDRIYSEINSSRGNNLCQSSRSFNLYVPINSSYSSSSSSFSPPPSSSSSTTTGNVSSWGSGNQGIFRS
jgi:hypothetical protein